MKNNNLFPLFLSFIGLVVLLAGQAKADSVSPDDVQMWQFAPFGAKTDYSYNVKFFDVDGVDDAMIKLYYFNDELKSKKIFEYKKTAQENSSSVQSKIGTTPFYFELKYKIKISDDDDGDDDHDKKVEIYTGYDITNNGSDGYTLSFKYDGTEIAEITGLKASPVPLPGALLLLSSGLAGLGMIRRRKTTIQ